MLQRALIFLAGVLVGANLVYLVMNRPAQVQHADPHVGPDAARQVQQPAGNAESGAAADAAWLGRDGLRPAAPPHPAQPGVPSTDREVSAQTPAVSAAPIGTSAPGPRALTVPVTGVAPSELSDTFSDARGADRVHDAIDIMAPRGTPVIAVADGQIEKLFDSERGGLTIYQFEPSGRYAYYYAHLDRYAPSLAEGQAVRQGEVIGYVGSTGNASPDAPHLHFAVFVLGPERSWWKGAAINPYPLLAEPRR